MKFVDEAKCVWRTLSISRLLLIALLISAISMVISCTSMVLHGLYTSLGLTVAPNTDRVLVIYSGSAYTPYTGLIPRSVEYRLRHTLGSENVWSEVVLPALVNGKPIIVRGIDTKTLCRVVGDELCREVVEKPFTAVVGVDAASYLGIAEGEEVVLYPLFTAIPLKLRIVGVVDVGNPYRGEVLVSLSFAQKLRGVGRDTVSMVRVVYRSRSEVMQILRSIGLKSAETNKQLTPLYLVERIAITLVSGAGKPVAMASSSYIDMFTKRFGFSRDMLTIATSILAILSSFTVYTIGRSCVVLHLDRLRVLSEVGVSRKRIALHITMITAPIVTIAILCGMAIAMNISKMFSLYIFGYSVEPCVDLITMAIELTSFLTLYILGIVRSEVVS